jgi:hypothetical protein
MRHKNIAYASVFVLLTALLSTPGLSAQDLSGQHSLCLQSAPEFLLAMSTDGPILPQAGLRSEIDSRYALIGPCFADFSFGAFLAAPSAFSRQGQRYRGYASAFGATAIGLILPIASRHASVEIGASLHIASWTGTNLAFSIIEINGAFRLQDPSIHPFYADFGRGPDGRGGLRAELTIPFALSFLSDSCALSFGLGIGLRRDAFERTLGEVSGGK